MDVGPPEKNDTGTVDDDAAVRDSLNDRTREDAEGEDAGVDLVPDPPEAPIDLGEEGKDGPSEAAPPPPDTPPPPDVALQPNGSPCLLPGQCQSGVCASGVCCDRRCDETCESCALAPGGTCQAKPTALIGHWRFDDGNGKTAVDSSCQKNDGMLMEFGRPSWAAGRVGGALEFDGANTWVKVPASASIASATEAITLAAWTYRAASFGTWRGVATRQIEGTSGETYHLALRFGVPSFTLAPSGTDLADCRAAAATPLETWVHLAGTWNRAMGTATLFVDGTAACTFVYRNALPAPTTPLIIGGNANTIEDDAQEIFAGRIDELVMYNRALTAAEIAALAQGGPPPAQ